MKAIVSRLVSPLAPWAVAAVFGLLAALAVPPPAQAVDPDKPWRVTTYLSCVTGQPVGLEMLELCNGNIVWEGTGRLTECFTVTIFGDCV
jgi:hypothetical protein